MFLNKDDIFQNQIKTKSLRQVEYFQDYSGRDDDVSGSRQYFKKKILALNNNPAKEIYVHTTNAKDTKALAKVLVSVTDIIMKENMNLLLL